MLDESDGFGWSVATIDDLDGDGNVELRSGPTSAVEYRPQFRAFRDD